MGDFIKPARKLRLGSSRLAIPAVQPDWIGAGLMAIARGLRLAAHRVPRASLRFALGYLMMPLWGCGMMSLIARGLFPGSCLHVLFY